MAGVASREHWRVLRSTSPWSTPYLRLRCDTVRTHSGSRIDYTYHDHPGSVAVVACTGDGRIVMLRQYRHPVRAWCWEVPAGHVVPGRSALAIARAELEEEAGGRARQWRSVGAFFPNSCSSNERMRVYFASDVSLGRNRPEATELLRMQLVPWRVALRMAATGRVSDGTSALALLLCSDVLEKRKRQGEGFKDGRQPSAARQSAHRRVRPTRDRTGQHSREGHDGRPAE